MSEAGETGAGSSVRWQRRATQVALLVVGVAVAVLVVWVLGPGAKWWLVHVDGLQVGGKAGLAGKDLADALDTVRGRAMAIATGLLAAVAIYYTASNAASARRSAQAAIEGVEAARLSAEATERAQLRTFELTQEGQLQSEEAQRRTHELTEHGQRTDRFTAAVAQLGDPSPAIQLGGVHALAGLADDSPTREFRQTCIDVLCAFLRLPYAPDPGDALSEGRDPAEHARARADFRAIREVRHTVIRIIGNHLRNGASVSWQGHDLDFTDVVFDGGDLHDAVFTNGHVSFRGAHFIDGSVNFSRAWFEGGTVDFINAKFDGGGVYFNGARFEGASVHFSYAQFRGGTVEFNLAQFSGGTVDFSSARFGGDAVLDFVGAGFSGGSVDFGSARFEDGTVNFSGAQFAGGVVIFEHAWVGGDAEIHFYQAPFTGARVDLARAKFVSGSVNFGGARFEEDLVDFSGARFEGGKIEFGGAEFAGGLVKFDRATGRRPSGLPDGMAPNLL